MISSSVIHLFGGRVYAFLLAHATDGELRLVGELSQLFQGRLIIDRKGTRYELFLPKGLFFGLESEVVLVGVIRVPLYEEGGDVLCHIHFACESTDRSRSVVAQPTTPRPTQLELARDMEALLKRISPAPTSIVS